MSFEGFDEWDEKFLDQAIRLEEEAISSRNPTQTNVKIPQHVVSHAFEDELDFNFSPPRELSQRVIEKYESTSRSVKRLESTEPQIFKKSSNSVRGGREKEKETERLKRELLRVSQQLVRLEHDCLELKRDKEKKEDDLKCALSKIEVKDAEIQCLKSKNVEQECSTNSVESMEPQKCFSGNEEHNGFGPQSKYVQGEGKSAISESKYRILTSRGHNALMTSDKCSAQGEGGRSVGIQTDAFENHDDSIVDPLSFSHYDLTSTLHDIWNTPHSKRSTQIVVYKLFVTCAADFSELFRHSVQSNETTKVSRVSMILTKVKDDITQLDTLFDALLDLCANENGPVVYRSLRVMHTILYHKLCFDDRLNRSSSAQEQ